MTDEAKALVEQSVIVGDCIEVMAAMDAKSVDVVVTSPPYNLGINYRSYSDSKPEREYMAWMAQVAAEIYRVLKDDGALFLNVGSTNKDPWIATRVGLLFADYFTLQNNIAWVKSISVGDETKGHFKPINSPRYLNNNYEHVFHFTKTGAEPVDRLAIGVPYADKSNLGRWGHATSDRRCAGNVWFVPYETVSSKAQKFHHPAAFPVALAERCIRLHGKDEGLVLDPFAGIGSTLMAAQRVGINAVGIELDEVYANSAKKRLTQ